VGHDTTLFDEPVGTYKQTSRGQANVPPHENSRDDISGDPKTKRDPKYHQFISDAALSLRGWKIESRRKRPTLDGPIIFPDFQRVTTMLYSKLLVFPLSNFPHFFVGSLSLPYLSSR